MVEAAGLLKRSSSWEGRGEASRVWEQGKTLDLQCLDSGPARCVAGPPPATRFDGVLGEGDWATRFDGVLGEGFR